jgi:DNA-binding phage protein
MQLKESSKANQVGEVENFLADLQRDPTQKLMRRRARVAGQLSALIATLELSHVKVAQKSGIKPSQLSRQLSGDANLTLDTISRICEAVGADFDLVFRRRGEAAPVQWWERQDKAHSQPPLSSTQVAFNPEWEQFMKQFMKQQHNANQPSAGNDERFALAA